MKNYVVQTNNELVIVKATKPTGDWAKDVVGEVPDSLVGRSLKILETTEEFGEVTQTVVLDEVADAQRVADEAQVAQEAKVAKMRSERDILLKETDFTQLSDAPITAEKKAEFATYRQALRDLPSTILDINNFNFPTKPE